MAENLASANPILRRGGGGGCGGGGWQDQSINKRKKGTGSGSEVSQLQLDLVAFIHGDPAGAEDPISSERLC